MTWHDQEDENQAANVDFALWRHLFRFTRPYKRELWLLMLAAVGTAAMDTLFPLITRHVVDDVAEAGLAGANLTLYASLYAATTLGMAGCVWAFIRLAGKLRTHLAHDIRRAGFANLQRLSFRYFDEHPVGWLVARMTSDCERLSNLIAWGTLDIVWGLTLTAGIAVAMLIMNAYLALLVLAVVPLLAVLSVFFQRRILRTSRRIRGTNSRITAAFNESVMAVRTTKAFVREDEDLAGFRELTGTMEDVSVKNALMAALYLPLVVTLCSVATGLALAVGGLDVAGELITLGTLVAFMTYTTKFFEPVQEMAAWLAEMQMAQAAAERVLGLIGTEPDVADSPAVRAAIEAHAARPAAGAALAEDGLPDRIGTLSLQNVGFAYEPGQPVLSDIDLVVEPGETIALVGATGGGKSTLVSLLCRFYEPTTGRILVDGVDLRERSLHWLQSRLGIVLQTPHLFSGSVAENIRYGRLDASESDVQLAATLAGADDVIRSLPDGFDTEVGEGGTLLSTGQRQLISFARAILADPQLLVMDEATSSVDTDTEQRIQRGLAAVLAGRTCFVIAHRLSTIRSADRILVIDGGRIVEQGTHASLIEQRGRYHDLYVQQRLREDTSADWTAAPAPAT